MPRGRLYGVLIGVLLLGSLLVRPGGVELAPVDGWSLRPQDYHPYRLGTLWPAILMLLLCGGVVLWLCRRDGQPLSRRRAALAVTLLTLLGFLLPIAVDLGMGLDGWARSALGGTWSTLSNGYFATALQHPDLLGFLRDYEVIQRADTMKLSTHPPGAVLLYWLPLQVYHHLPPLQALMQSVVDWVTAGDPGTVYVDAMIPPNVPREMRLETMAPTLWCVFVLGAVSAGAVIPTYLLGALTGRRRVGVLAAALLLLAPNTLFYALALDPVLMTFSTWGLVLGIYAANDTPRRDLYALGAGLAFGAMTMISIGALAALAILACYLLLRLRADELTPRAALRVALCGSAGIVLVLLLYTAAGLDTWEVLTHCLSAHEGGAGGIGHRKYLPWLPFNLIDYALLLGLPLAFTAGEAVWRGDVGEERLRRLGYAAALALLLLNLSGTVRGETERIWVFFNPAWAALAAAAVRGRAERFWPLACQPLQLLLMTLSLPPLVRPY